MAVELAMNGAIDKFDVILYAANVKLILEISSALDSDFIMAVQRCLFSITEMMQANAKIARNKIQNDIQMPRRKLLHHGSYI